MNYDIKLAEKSIQGYFDYIDEGATLLIEWSENIEAVLPEDCIRVKINKTDDNNERIIEISGVE